MKNTKISLCLGACMLMAFGIVFSACDGVAISTPTPACSANDKQDYATFIIGVKAVNLAYGDLKEAFYKLDDWPADAAELQDVKDQAEKGRVDLETFCSEIKDALILTINDNPQIQASMATNAIVSSFGIPIESTVDVKVFETGTLNGPVQINDTVVVYLGEEHLPYTKKSKIETYNKEIAQTLGDDHKLPIRSSLHYCAVDAFPVLIANQLKAARNGNVEAMAFLMKIENMMAEFQKYIDVVPDVID